MTTDITELAQKRNAAISRLSRVFEPGHSSQTELDALSFAVDVMYELVEALEKAQRTIAFQQGEINALLSSLESRTVTAAASDVLAERQRQVTAEGWTPGHDVDILPGMNAGVSRA